MHGKPHTMTAKFADHGIAVFPGKGLDGRANVAQRVLPANSILHAAAETFLRDAYEIPAIVRHVSEHEHAGSIPNISLVDGRGIDIDDITVFKDHIGAWDAVTDYIVHRGADAFRKALKIKAGRSGIVADRIFVDNAVNFFRRHTHVDCLFHGIQDFRVEPSRFADARNLFRCLDHLHAGDFHALRRKFKEFHLDFFSFQIPSSLLFSFLKKYDIIGFQCIDIPESVTIIPYPCNTLMLA